MSNSSRIFALVATVVVLAVAFVVFSPGGDDEPSPGPVTTVATVPPAATNTATATATAPPPPPQPQFETVRVRAGKPLGGVQRIELKKGDRARIEVASQDTSDEVHIHGYDLSENLEAGGLVRFSFDATAEGIYEIELEGAGVQIAELAVEPG